MTCGQPQRGGADHGDEQTTGDHSRAGFGQQRAGDERDDDHPDHQRR